MTQFEKWTVGLTVVIALGTAVAGVVAVGGLWAQLSKDAADKKERDEKEAAERREKEEQDWEAVQVYKILEGHAAGLTLDEISDKYVAAAQKSTDVHLPKKKLQDLELRKVLLGLLAAKLVAQTNDDHYLVPNSTVIPNGTQTYAVNRAVDAILTTLASEGGRYTVEELQPIAIKQATISAGDYHIAITGLLATGQVTAEQDNKLWSAEHPPKKRKD
jgi:hypothetical protein